MNAADFEHGDARRYRRGCRCRPCTDAVARREKERLHLKATGAWRDPRTDAAPVRARLLGWRAAGLDWREIAALTGVKEDTLRQIAHGRPSKPAPNRVRRDIVGRIMGARVTMTRRAPGALVDATATRRRLRALAVAGWHLGLLAQETGLSRAELGEARRGVNRLVRARSADQVRAVFERIGSASPAQSSKDVVLTARRAARAGWVPVERWGEDIDDPAASPLAAALPAPPRPLAVAENVAFILRTSGVEDYDLIAQRLGIKRDTLDRNLDRARVLALTGAAA